MSQLFICGMFISNVPLTGKTVSLNRGYKMILLREPSQVWSKKVIYFHWPSWSSELRFSSLAHLRVKHGHHACNYSREVISRNEHRKGNGLPLATLYFSRGELARGIGGMYFHVGEIIKTLSICISHLFFPHKKITPSLMVDAININYLLKILCSAWATLLGWTSSSGARWSRRVGLNIYGATAGTMGWREHGWGLSPCGFSSWRTLTRASSYGLWSVPSIKSGQALTQSVFQFPPKPSLLMSHWQMQII